MESLMESSCVHAWQKIDAWLPGLQGRYRKLDENELARPDTPLPEEGAVTVKVKPLTCSRREKILAGMRLRNRQVFPLDSEDGAISNAPEILQYTFIVEDVVGENESVTGISTPEDIPGRYRRQLHTLVDSLSQNQPRGLLDGGPFTGAASQRVSRSPRKGLSLIVEEASTDESHPDESGSVVAAKVNRGSWNNCTRKQFSPIAEEAWSSERLQNGDDNASSCTKNSVFGLIFMCSCSGYKVRKSKVGCQRDENELN